MTHLYTPFPRRAPCPQRSPRSTIGSPWRRASSVILIACIALGGCAKSPRLVTLAVADDSGSPVEAAHVRAIALRTNDLPLPVSMKNLASLDRALVSGVTDSLGAVRLEVRTAGAYLVEVTGPPSGPLSADGPWRWRLAPYARSLTPIGQATRASDAPPDPAITLHLITNQP